MFGKLFASMYDGTLATQGPWQALITFQQLVILADKTGIVDMTPEAIARRTTIPLDIIEQGIERLQEPDDKSRTPTDEGRRIKLLSPHRNWGWQIVNYEHYRMMRSTDERREYHRQYYHEKRKAKSTDSTVSTSSTDYTQSTKAVSSMQYAVCKDSKSLAANATRSPPKQNGKIEFDHENGVFKGITEDQELRWQTAYPAVPIPPAIEQAAAWAKANPANRKSNWERFLVNWFSRAQDKAARVRH